MAPRLTVVALVALVVAAPARGAQTPIIDRAADAERGQSVYFDPGNELLTPRQARSLARQIEREARGPMYIAVLPAAARDEADGTATGVALELNRRS